MTDTISTYLQNNPLTHQAIEHLLSHTGSMSLLNEILSADKDSLTATAISHLESNNPLRAEGSLSTVNGIEYAAQAMAVHGALLAQHSGAEYSTQKGYIATVRNIEINKPFFPETEGVLLIQVRLLMSNDNGFTYEFHINYKQDEFISGKITVFLIQP